MIPCLWCGPSFAFNHSGRRRNSLSAYLVMLAVLLAGTCNLGRAQQTSQLLHNHVHREITGGQAPLVGSLPPGQQMNLSIVLPLRNQTELASLLQRLYDPTSPDFRQFLTVDQFTERFGPTAHDYQAAVSFARANGFTVTGTPVNRLIVPITRHSGSDQQRLPPEDECLSASHAGSHLLLSGS